MRARWRRLCGVAPSMGERGDTPAAAASRRTIRARRLIIFVVHTGLRLVSQRRVEGPPWRSAVASPTGVVAATKVCSAGSSVRLYSASDPSSSPISSESSADPSCQGVQAFGASQDAGQQCDQRREEEDRRKKNKKPMRRYASVRCVDTGAADGRRPRSQRPRATNTELTVPIESSRALQCSVHARSRYIFTAPPAR
jgi:hypothetical protein